MFCNILLVEDEPLARRNIMIFLQRASHNVHQAETGEAAIDLFRASTSIPSYQIFGYREGSMVSTS
jgi:DNA-binding response OmpR family regulator